MSKKKPYSGVYHYLVTGKYGGALCGPRAIGISTSDAKAITCKRCIFKRKHHPFK